MALSRSPLILFLAAHLSAPDLARAAIPAEPLLAPTADPSEADLSAEADRRSRAGDPAGAAALWAQLAARVEPGATRYVFGWKAIVAWERAYAVDHDPRHLCAAHDLTRVVLRDHLRYDHRHEFEIRLGTLEGALADHRPLHLCATEAPPSSSTPPPPADRPSSTSLSPPAPLSVEPPTAARVPPAPAVDTRSARRSRIAGAIALPLGVGLLGVMTYAIAEDARQIALVRDYDAKNQRVGLTPDEAADARQALARARSASYLTLGSGVAGAALTLTGAALLVHTRRQLRSNLAFRPTFAPTSAAFTLAGRF